MARLNNNCWVRGHSDDTLARANNGNAVLNLIIDEQSAHGIFSIAGSNALKWQGDVYPGAGQFIMITTVYERDGDDNEEGWAQVAYDYGIVGTTQQDAAVEQIGQAWSNLNTTHPDNFLGINGGTSKPIISDAANQVLSFYWMSRTFWNAALAEDPSFGFHLFQLGP
jgi:hypothetical protein